MTDASASQKAEVSSTWVIDRIENGVASVEADGATMISIPRALLPKGTKEGDVLRVSIAPDPQQQAKLMARSAAQVKKGGTGGTGNITL